MTHRILTVNAGSSSLKFAVYKVGEIEERLAVGQLERIGLNEGRFRAARGFASIERVRPQDDRVDRSMEMATHDVALTAVIDWLKDEPVTAIGHRIVQGGPTLTKPTLLTPESLEELKRLVPLAPNHLPGEIAAVEAARRAFPNLAQVLCFDTAFHNNMPEVAQRFGLPREFHDEGVRRYGFHGLSYQYIVDQLSLIARPEETGRVVIAHLGNGASLAAVKQGRGVDTTMGLTPIGGLLMGTRVGDLDPGAVLHVMRSRGLTVDQAEELLAKKSGLLGVSGVSSDMRDLLERERSDPAAADAIALFCRQACKHIAAMAVSLGGIDTLVFTAGIGERSAPIRQRIGLGLGFLGVAIDAERNQRDEAIISAGRSTVMVRVMRTNEELMIARQTAACL